MLITNKIAFLTVNWNGFDDTINCVESIRKTDKTSDIIIVDNGSSNNEFARLKRQFLSDKRIVVIESKKNTGFCGGNNIGFDYARKNKIQYLILINNDAAIDDKFAEQFRAMTENKDLPMLMGAFIYEYKERYKLQSCGIYFNPIAGLSYNISSPNQRRRLFVSGTCFAVNMAKYCEKNLFDQNYFCYYEEVDLCQRVIKIGGQIEIRADLKVFHKGSVSAKKIGGFTEYQSIRNRFYNLAKNSKFFEKMLHILWQIIYFPLKTLNLFFFNRNNLKFFFSGYADGIKIFFKPQKASELTFQRRYGKT